MKKRWSATLQDRTCLLKSNNGTCDGGLNSAPHAWANGDKNDRKSSLSFAGSSATESVLLDGGLFGGMEIVPARHKKSGVITTGSHSPSRSEERKPFFMRYQMHFSPIHDEVESPQVERMRRRLERFFEDYCPSKLSQVEVILKEFIGKEDELFTQLVSTYGPEPKELKASALERGDNCVCLGTASETGSAFGFIANDIRKHNHSNHHEDVFANSSLSVGGGGSFPFLHRGNSVEPNPHGMQRKATGAGHFSHGNPLALNTTGKAESISRFSFISPSEPMTLEDQTSREEIREDAEYKGECEKKEKKLVGDNSESERYRACPPNGSELVSKDTKENGKILTGDGNNFENEFETLWERQQREIMDSRGNVLLARAGLSRVLDEISTSIEQRREYMTKIKQVENRIAEFVAQETFEEADILSNELEQLNRRVDELDAAPLRLLESLNQQKVETIEMVHSLALLFQKHRQELIESKDEEDRRVKKFIQDVAFQLESRKEKVAAALERMKRLEENTEQERRNLSERKVELREKMLLQNKELRALQVQLSKDKMLIEEEIAAVELRLSKLRELDAAKTAEMRDVTLNLASIESEQESLESEINDLLKEEENRSRSAAAEREQLQRESDALDSEANAFDTKKKSLLSELQDNISKIDSYAECRTLLETETLSSLQLCVNTVVELVRMRSAGHGVLFTRPSFAASIEITEENKDDTEYSSPLSKVNRLKGELHALNAEDEKCETFVGSVMVQLTEVRNNITILEAAKKSAAQAMRFKEAQLKADEVRRLTTCLIELKAKSDAAHEMIRSNALRRSSLRQELISERAKAAERVGELLSQYHETLEVAVKAASQSATPNVLQIPEEEQCGNDFTNAMQKLLTTLQQEYSDVLLCEEE